MACIPEYDAAGRPPFVKNVLHVLLFAIIKTDNVNHDRDVGTDRP